MKQRLVVLDALLVRPRPTGVGRAILELAAALARRDRGLDFIIMATQPEMFSHLAEVPGWRVVACPGARGGTLRKAVFTQFEVPGLLRRLGADLLHSLQFVAPLRLPCPSVVTVHDLGYLWYPQTIEQPRRAYYRALVPRTLRRAARIVCNSQATAQDVRQRFPDLADRVRTTLFGTPSWVWGMPEAHFERSPQAPFLFVGTLEPRKNLENLLDAYTSMRAARRAAGKPVPGFTLVGGRGWHDSDLRVRIQGLAAEGDLEVRDYCGTEELWQRYISARALLFPSRHEGFGFPILEAMAAKLPVLTSARGAMAEVAGDAAILVDPDCPDEIAAALDRLADDAPLRRELATRGAARARAWDWERTAEATVASYDEVLSRGR